MSEYTLEQYEEYFNVILKSAQRPVIFYKPYKEDVFEFFYFSPKKTVLVYNPDDFEKIFEDDGNDSVYVVNSSIFTEIKPTDYMRFIDFILHTEFVDKNGNVKSNVVLVDSGEECEKVLPTPIMNACVHLY